MLFVQFFTHLLVFRSYFSGIYWFLIKLYDLRFSKVWNLNSTSGLFLSISVGNGLLHKLKRPGVKCEGLQVHFCHYDYRICSENSSLTTNQAPSIQSSKTVLLRGRGKKYWQKLVWCKLIVLSYVNLQEMLN